MQITGFPKAWVGVGGRGGCRVEELIESIKSSSNLKPPPWCKQNICFSTAKKKKESLFSEDTVLEKLWCYWVGVTKSRGEVPN